MLGKHCSVKQINAGVYELEFSLWTPTCRGFYTRSSLGVSLMPPLSFAYLAGCIWLIEIEDARLEPDLLYTQSMPCTIHFFESWRPNAPGWHRRTEGDVSTCGCEDSRNNVVVRSTYAAGVFCPPDSCSRQYGGWMPRSSRADSYFQS